MLVSNIVCLIFPRQIALSLRKSTRAGLWKGGQKSSRKEEGAHIYSTNCIAHLLQTTCKWQPSVPGDRIKLTRGAPPKRRNESPILNPMLWSDT